MQSNWETTLFNLKTKTMTNSETMKADLRIEQDDLKTLFAHTKGAFGNMTFTSWVKEDKKSYMSYFNNKELFSKKKYTYSQFVNAQIIALY